MTAVGIGATVDIGHGRGRLAPDAAASLARIDRALGRPADVNSAWRDPVDQAAKRAAWVAYNAKRGPWAPYALTPDGSVHCAGYAADSDDWYTPADAAVWRAHGWRQTALYPVGDSRREPWHGEYFAHLDLYRFDPAPAALNTLEIEDDMFTDDDRRNLAALVADRTAAGGVQYYERDGGNGPEWMVVDYTLPPLATDPKQDGYRVFVTLDDAEIIGRQYSGADTVSVHLGVDTYIRTQAWARSRAAEYRAGMVAIVRAALYSTVDE